MRIKTKSEKRDDYLKNTYGGMSLQLYEKKLKEQKGVCEICGRAPKPGKNLAVDHDHSCCRGKKMRPTCGKCTRSLLCFRCNKYVVGVIERMRIDPQKVADYLKKYPRKNP